MIEGDGEVNELNEWIRWMNKVNEFLYEFD